MDLNIWTEIHAGFLQGSTNALTEPRNRRKTERWWLQKIYQGVEVHFTDFRVKEAHQFSPFGGNSERTGRKGQTLAVHEIRIDLHGIPTL